LSGQSPAPWRCPQCGYVASNDDLPENLFFRPWHVRGRAQVKAYVESLGQEAREWLLALYVDKDLQLLAVDTIGRGGVSGVRVSFARILCRGHELNAAGFILVHNHPSGDPRPSRSDIEITGRLRRASAELEMPLLEHLIIAGDEVTSVGGF
jgi:DNA repair protein RadC